MWEIHARRHRRLSLLDKYAGQMGHLVKNRLTQQALMEAKREAERAAETAHAALLAAEEANRAKTQFLANMSHELRTPLNAIIGFSDVIANELLGPDPKPSRYQVYARDINDAGGHLLAVINDILDIAKIESGELNLDSKVFDSAAAIKACLKMIQEQASSAGLQPLEFSQEGRGGIIADEKKFRQIIINLVSNAMKFTREGGRVGVETALAEDGRFRVTVWDTGIGIRPEDVQKVLEPFRQVDSALSRQNEGTGLGLPITKALVELHGGTLEITSKVDVGTRVVVHLPAERVAAPKGERQP
ncbi:MAG: HAMP domain-containing histidine kinase [Alphaproteobacteria bacterium]|nr:HAMP domain-containing histidine kinase [Alphaproteobacteria bacterium]